MDTSQTKKERSNKEVDATAPADGMTNTDQLATLPSREGTGGSHVGADKIKEEQNAQRGNNREQQDVEEVDSKHDEEHSADEKSKDNKRDNSKGGR